LRKRVKSRYCTSRFYILTHAVNAEKEKAKFDNGLLNIEIPIKKILKGKKIAIK